ncbi:MAG: acyl--CoA ligase [Rhodobacteraceae bacterium]|nr:acyl--CoA ligase [Paracoccaceae bacterium]
MTAMSLHEAVHHVTTTNPTFAVGQADIRGVRYKVFENVPPHVPALMMGSRAAQGDGAADYLIYEDERWTYDAFCDDVHSMAQVLRDHGVTKGQPVAIAMRNCPELLILTLAIASVGAVTVFVNAWWTTPELDYALRDSGARIVFADGARIARLADLIGPLGLTVAGVRDGEQTAPRAFSDLLNGARGAAYIAPDLETDDDFAIMYSSGTTGHPKGVVQTHRGAINAVFTWLMQAVMAPLVTPPPVDAPAAPRPSVLVVTPLFHVTATHPMFLLSMPAGAKIALMYKWDADAAVRLIRDEKITRFLGVPTQSADLMEAAKRLGEPLPSLDFLGSGGAKRPAAQVAELAQTFPRAQVATGWGMTETNANGIGMAGLDYVARPGSAGRLYPPVQELRFLDDAGRDVGVGEIGEITVKSPCNMRCYLNKPAETAETMQDGWLRTGDLGMIDADGFVTIVDRKKNIIIRGGENIACLDVEGALHRHPAVAEACAFAVPHSRLGEVVGAGVQLRRGMQTTPEELRAFLAEHIAAFKIPEHIWLRADPLPRGATDKIDRRALRAACLQLEEQKAKV